MNFLAHAHVARQVRDDPEFVLGAVLPDLLPLLGLTVDRASLSGAVADGWRFHHVTDEAFHGAPEFRTGVQALRQDLRSTELHTGARRAVAHVGWELLLDDVVATDLDTIAAFRAALDVSHSILGPESRRFWRDPGPRTIGVAVRVHRAVSRRERLAFDAGLVPEVEIVLERHRGAVEAAAPAVLYV